MKIPKAATMLERSEHTVRNWVRSGVIHAVKLGRDWDISAEEVERIKQDGLNIERKEENA